MEQRIPDGFEVVGWCPVDRHRETWYPDSGYVAVIKTPTGATIEEFGDTLEAAAFRALLVMLTEGEAEES